MIHFKLRWSFSSNLLIQSGTVFTRLVTPAYIAVRDEFRRRVKVATVTSLGGFDTCFSVPIVAPTITFLFTGMNVSLPPDNLLIHSTAGSITCLEMAAAPDNVNSVLNVIACSANPQPKTTYNTHFYIFSRDSLCTDFALLKICTIFVSE